jgi:hypothetical protein
VRITTQLLSKLAKEATDKGLSQYKDVVSVYLTGSVLTQEPLLGGTTDIDLVFIHKEEPPVDREIFRISYEVSLDIMHHHQSFYAFHRRLRLNPWLGYAICSHKSLLFDTDHWLEFIQASVSSQFLRPENSYERSQPFLEKARTLWFELEEPQTYKPHVWLSQFLKSVEFSSNAFASLSGPALTTRRFLLDFSSRSAQFEHHEIYPHLLSLIGINNLSKDQLVASVDVWERVLTTVGKIPNTPLNFHPARKAYYLECVKAMIESGTYEASLWPILTTWTQAMHILYEEDTYKNEWLDFCSILGLEPSQHSKLVNSLDAYLDTVEISLEKWKQTYGF